MSLTIEWAEDGNIPSFTTQEHYNYILSLLAAENPYPSDVSALIANHLAIIFPINPVSRVDLHTPDTHYSSMWDCYGTDFTPSTIMNGRFWYVRQIYNEYFTKIDYTNADYVNICRNYKETDSMIVYVINHTMPLTINGESPAVTNIKLGNTTPLTLKLGTENAELRWGTTKVWG